MQDWETEAEEGRRGRRTGRWQARGPDDGWNLSPWHGLPQFSIPEHADPPTPVSRTAWARRGGALLKHEDGNQANSPAPDRTTVFDQTTSSLVEVNGIPSPRGKLRQRGRDEFLVEVTGGLVLCSLLPAHHP